MDPLSYFPPGTVKYHRYEPSGALQAQEVLVSWET
jgi:hypothetical protein